MPHLWAFLSAALSRVLFAMCRAFDESDAAGRVSRHFHPLHLTVPSKYSVTSASSSQTYVHSPPSASPTPLPATTPTSPGPPTATAPSPPPVIHFKAKFCGLTVGASLLPSLRAQYKVQSLWFTFHVACSRGPYDHFWNSLNSDVSPFEIV